MDSGSSIDLFANKDLVDNVRATKQVLELSTNAGSKISNTKADVPDYGEVWYVQDAIANIFALCNMIKHHRVAFDSEKENAFQVHTSKGIMKFAANNQGLYVFIHASIFLYI